MRDDRQWVFLAAFLAPALVASATIARGPSQDTASPAATGPVIEDYGPVYEVEAPDFATPRERETRAVFDVARSPDPPDRLNPSIVTVARFLNLHARAGVPREHLGAALVLHGGAGKDALSHAAYRKRFGTENPNLELIARLRDAGVRVILCGQTARSRGFDRAELQEPVELALSAMTALIALQQDGYALIAF